MRISFLNRIGWPDEGATSIYLTDVAEALARRGHDVNVICGDSSYRAGESHRSAPFRRGVHYQRLGGGPRPTSMSRRAITAVGFLFRAGYRLLTMRRPDVIVGMTDPPFADVIASAAGRVRGVPVVHWVMDVYPEIAERAGVVPPGSGAAKLLSAVMGLALRAAARVVVLGRAMRRPVLAQRVPRHRIRVIENWAPSEVDEALPIEPRASNGSILIMYSGNYGRAHDVGALMELGRALPADAPLRLVFQVTGARCDELRTRLADVRVPWEIRPPTLRSELAASLRGADIHVVSVRDGYEHLLVPSKIYAPLRIGIPVMTLGPRNSEPARIVRRTGLGIHLSDGACDANATVERIRDIIRSRSGTPATPPAATRIDAWVRLLEDVAKRGRGIRRQIVDRVA